MIRFDEAKCTQCEKCLKACPFGAIERTGDRFFANAACKLCKLCIRACPAGAISLETERAAAVDKRNYSGILVYVEHTHGKVHPVTYELIGKARELASVTGQEVSCLFVGKNLEAPAQDLLRYGVKNVYLYDNPALEYFRVDSFTNVFEDCVQKHRPSAILVGATSTGRSLAPRVAARFHTGLTADCTVLQMRENTDLVQIRPAFGGNIMAQIITANHRPQMATVRYKVMDAAQPCENPDGCVCLEQIAAEKLNSGIRLLEIQKKEKQSDITEADVLVVAGRGVRDADGMAMLNKLADLLKAQIAMTRPMVEAGWGDYTQQIGLSGRTVKPKLILTFGVSGAVQFTAGMDSSECIFAVNQNPEAPIFHKAHYAVVGDLYQILPGLIARIEEGKTE